MFSPEPPAEFEFAFASPPARKLFRAKTAPRLGEVEEGVVRLELEALGENAPAGRPLDAEHVRRVEQHACAALVADLRKHFGITAADASEPRAVLMQKLELARLLRRRAELRRILASASEEVARQLRGQMPDALSLAELQAILRDRRIHTTGLSHSRAARALEEAIIKEDVEGLVGDGYQFGRRLVSAYDVIAFEDPSAAFLAECLKNKGDAVVPRSRTARMARLHELVEAEQMRALHEPLCEQIRIEMERPRLLPDGSRLVVPAVSAVPAVATPEKAPAGGNSDETVNRLFARLFESGVWRLEYADVDHAPLPLVVQALSPEGVENAGPAAMALRSRRHSRSPSPPASRRAASSSSASSASASGGSSSASAAAAAPSSTGSLRGKRLFGDDASNSALSSCSDASSDSSSAGDNGRGCCLS